MNTLLTIATPLAHDPDRWGPGPWFLVFPLLFWTAIVLLFVFGRRRVLGRQGEGTLRDTYARGEITEAEYRQRLAVLKETRR
jgi:putative membrane protein